jgi:hypothetical protein
MYKDIVLNTHVRPLTTPQPKTPWLVANTADSARYSQIDDELYAREKRIPRWANILVWIGLSLPLWFILYEFVGGSIKLAHDLEAALKVLMSL